LAFEQFEGVEAEFRLWDFERFLEDGGGFVLYQEEVAVGFVFTNLLHDAEIVDGGEEVAPGEVGDRLEGNIGSGDGVAKFIDFGGAGGLVGGRGGRGESWGFGECGEIYGGRRPRGLSAKFDDWGRAGLILASIVLPGIGSSVLTVGLTKTEEPIGLLT
jgi:hypothetical protein